MEKIIRGSFFSSKKNVGNRIIQLFYYFPNGFSIDLPSHSFLRKGNDTTFLMGFTGRRKCAIKKDLRFWRIEK
jgi:hypothetical protein